MSPRHPSPGAVVAAVVSLLASGARVGAPAQVIPNEGAGDSLPVASEPPAEVRGRMDEDRAAPSARADSLTAEVASQLRCPVCRGQSVLESTASLSREMQAVIREKLAEGQSPAEVKAYFVDKYGSWILLKPEPEGMGLLVYLLPALALLGGGWLVARSLRRWADAGPARSAEGPSRDSLSAGDAPRSDAGERVIRELDELGGVSEEERAWLRRQLDERNQGGQRA